MKLSRLLLLVCFLFAAFGAKATHLVGGEISLQHQRGSQYLLTLKVYFDATGNAAAEDLLVGISSFTKNGNNLIETFHLDKKSKTSITSSNAGCGNTGRLFYDIRYEATVTLNDSRYFQSGGFYMSWERCCRNNAITNIIDPGDMGMVYYLEMPSLSTSNYDSSPVFSPVSGDFLCQNKLYQYSFGATDADGDQLVYSLVTPLKGHTTSNPDFVMLEGLPGPYSTVLWASNAIGSPISGSPSLSIDPVTGVLTVVPFSAGLFVFSVRCQEYRNGVLLGEVRRDYQWYVQPCQVNPAPAITIATPEGVSIPVTDTLVITDNTNNCFDLIITDGSFNEQVTVSALLNGQPGQLDISPTQAYLNGPGDTLKSAICWPDCNVQSPTPYDIKVTVKDNACPVPNKTDILIHVLVEPVPNALPAISVSPAQQSYEITINDPVSFTLFGSDADQDLVTLSAQGVGFSMAAYGMNFTPTSGKGLVSAPFSWVPDCNALSAQTTFQVKFTVRDNSCFSDHSDTLLVNITLKDILDLSGEFLPPNIFTPNKDGFNDYFTFANLPRDNCQDAFASIEVFNRWGNRVYKSQSRDFKWDGGGLADGLYYYLVSFEKKSYKGYLTLMHSSNSSAN